MRRAYLATELEICIDGYWLSASAAVADLGVPLYVLTAWNPCNERLSVAENRSRNKELESALLEECDDVLAAVGTSRGGRWREESLAALGLRRRAARRIGKKFGQHALFELKRDEQRVLGCADAWRVQRRYDEFVEVVPTEGANLLELLRDELRIDLDIAFARSRYPGWSSEGCLSVACPTCGADDLVLAGCDAMSQDETPYRAMVFICCAEPRVFLPHEVPSAYRALAQSFRAYATAASDADDRRLSERRYHAYVIELDDAVGARESVKPWVYVGQSRYPPEERFAQHLAGERASKHVRAHGVCLRWDLMADQPLLRTSHESKAYERLLYERLRAAGWSVKGGH
jgi:hypothetical protein